MDNTKGIVLGTLELKPHQNTLINEWAEVILMGSVKKAEEAFEIIFEKVPTELDMMIFRELCLQKIREQNGTDFGIKGVFDGGKSRH